MKTIEERAKETCDRFLDVGYLVALKEAFRELIEDCAKICDEHEQTEQAAADESRRNGKGLSQVGHVFEASAAAALAEKIRELIPAKVDMTKDAPIIVRAKWEAANAENQIKVREEPEP